MVFCANLKLITTQGVHEIIEPLLCSAQSIACFRCIIFTSIEGNEKQN
jgi:hypothetical protein